MSQNRKKLIDLFIGNVSNVVVHRLLERAIDDDLVAKRYGKEERTSFDTAEKYRALINPVQSPLPISDADMIRLRILARVKCEIVLRVSKGYKNLSLDGVERFVDSVLRELHVL